MARKTLQDYFSLPSALIAGALITLCSSSYAAETLSTAQAHNHIGEDATVCGLVAGTKYAENVPGSPAFINLDMPYPRQVFTILVWGESRGNFPSPPEATKGRICVSGTISDYNGVAQIIVTEPAQISRAR